MSSFNLEIIESVTAKRKPKKVLIPSEYFNTLQSENKPKAKSVVEWPGRMISSGVVTRQNLLKHVKQSPAQQSTSESIVKHNDEEPLYFKLPPHSSRMDRLRTPYTRKSNTQIVKRTSSDESYGMTRNCAQVFSQMMQDYRPDSPKSVDPSLSVRRIVRGSGILKTFGTGLLTDDGDVDVDDPLEMTAGSLSISRITGAENASALQVLCGPTVEKNALELLIGDEQVVPGTKKKLQILRSEDFMTSLLEEGAESNGRLTRADETFLKDFESNLKNLGSKSEVPTRRESAGVTFERDETTDEKYSSSQQSFVSYSSAPDTSRVGENNGEKYETLVLQETYEMEMVQYLPYPNVSNAIENSLQYKSGSSSSVSGNSTPGSQSTSEDGTKSESTEASAHYGHKYQNVLRQADPEETGSGYEPSGSSGSSS